MKKIHRMINVTMHCGPEECEEDVLGECMTSRILNALFYIYIMIPAYESIILYLYHDTC